MEMAMETEMEMATVMEVHAQMGNRDHVKNPPKGWIRDA
jgi:hypothetical protein